MAALRIAIASSGLGHVTRGIEGWAQDLATALHERGEDVTLFKGGGCAQLPYERVIDCMKRDDPATERLLSRIPQRVFWRIGLSTVYGIEQMTFGLKLIQHLSRGEFDVLHVQDPQLAWLINWARRLGLLPTVVVLAHGTNEPLSFLRKFRYVQHLAPWHLDQAQQAGTSKATWTAIPNFIDTQRFHPGRNDELRTELGIAHDAIVVLSVAAIKRDHKRIDYLIAEFGRLIQANPTLPLHLVVAGGAEADTPSLIQTGRALLPGRFTPLVSFSRARVPDLYRCADMFVLCSLREMMPIALVEATASGLPCIVHDHPIMSWMAGCHQPCIDMSRAGALAGAISRLCHDPAGMKTLGRQARRQCQSHFSRDQVVDQILRYYRFAVTDYAARTAPTACSTTAADRRSRACLTTPAITKLIFCSQPES